MSNNKKRRIQKYRSVTEFEKTFFPQSFKKKMAEVPKDVQALGISLAKESLSKIRIQLAK